MNEMKKGRNPLPGAFPTLRERQQWVFYMLHLKEEVQQDNSYSKFKHILGTINIYIILVLKANLTIKGILSLEHNQH